MKILPNKFSLRAARSDQRTWRELAGTTITTTFPPKCSHTIDTIKSVTQMNMLTIKTKIDRLLIAWLITSDLLSLRVAEGATSYSGQVYNVNAATIYANTWWDSQNGRYNYYPNDDCANFVSQCLIAGGLDLSTGSIDNWGSIINCQALKNYLISIGAPSTVLTRGDFYAGYTEPYSFGTGDVVIFQNDTVSTGHAMFAVSGDATHFATLAAHTINTDSGNVAAVFNSSNPLDQAFTHCTFLDLSTIGVAVPSSTVFSPGDSVKTTASLANLSMRKGPGVGYDSITSFPYGTILTVQQNAQNGKAYNGYYWWYLSSSGGIYTGWCAELYLQKSAQSPSMSLNYGGTAIPNGDRSPSAAKGTDFGSVLPTFHSLPRTFTISNNGQGALNLTGMPRVQFSGSNPSDFGMTVQPSMPVSANGGSTTFSLEFFPLAPGLRTAIVTIANDDPHNNPYAFMLQGQGAIQIWGSVSASGGSPLSGVVMSGLPGNPTTDSSGSYSVQVSSGWSGTVTPTLSGYTFNPPSRSYGSVSANQGEQDYAATMAHVQVSGNVHTSDGAPIGGVVMSGLPGNPTTASSGNYSAQVDLGWSGTVAPTLSGYTFTPYSRSYGSLSASQSGQDYVAAPPPPSPQIELWTSLSSITNGQNTPVNFGSVKENQTGPTITFTIHNAGGQNLTLGAVTVPTAYAVTQNPPSTIAPGGQGDFVIQLESSVVGTESGAVSIPNNDPSNNPFRFQVTGTVTGPEPPPQLTGMNASNRMFGFVLQGPVGGNYDIQASSDLIIWVSIETNTIPDTGSVAISDPGALDRPMRFYRAVAVTNIASLPHGTVVAWGDNSYGQTTVPSGLSGVIATSAGYFHSIALKTDGTVVAWGRNDSGQATVPMGLSGVKALSAGGYHNLCLKQDGTVVAWGSNQYGQTNVPMGLNGVLAVAASETFDLALKNDGTVVGWGASNNPAITPPVGLSGVKAIAVGYTHSMALKSDGTVVAWGSNPWGQTDVPVGLSGVIGIAAGWEYSLALKSDGTIVGWGRNDLGQANVPTGLSGVVAVAAGMKHGLAIKNDGTVIAWGDNTYGQAIVPAGLSGVKVVSGGLEHSLALVAAP